MMDGTPQNIPQQEPQDDLSRMREELEQAQTLADNNMDGWKRARADYLNLKKEAEKEKIELAQFANLSLIFELLPIADNFDRAFKHIPDDVKNQEWVKGILGIRQQLQSILQGIGLEPVKTDGAFNPELHEAVSHEPKDGVAGDTIIEVVEPGYMLHGRLVRPAKVKVAK